MDKRLFQVTFNTFPDPHEEPEPFEEMACAVKLQTQRLVLVAGLSLEQVAKWAGETRKMNELVSITESAHQFTDICSY
jgi:hypothetical protein